MINWLQILGDVMFVYENEEGYIELLKDVLKNGVKTLDRTGVGCIKVFDRKLIWNVGEQFPFSTFRPAPLRMAFEEFWMFMRGETQTKLLEEKKIYFWQGNTSREFLDNRNLDYLGEGEMGKAYGFAWRNFNGEYESVTQPEPKLKEGVDVTYLGIANDTGGKHEHLKPIWKQMIDRCYREDSVDYDLYGAKGASVCNDWLEFRRFSEDVMRIPGWKEKIANPQACYILDKDINGNGFQYSIDNCMWTTDYESYPQNYTVVVEDIKTGSIHTFDNVVKFAKKMNFDPKDFYDLWSDDNRNGDMVRNGYRLVSRGKSTQGIDQLLLTYNTLKNDPYSRRMYTTFWNPTQSNDMALTPCWHSHQFVVMPEKDGTLTLNLKLFSRSLDLAFGESFARQQYALYLICMARLVGMNVGYMSCDLTDVHIYLNQIEYVKEMVTRELGVCGHVEITKELNTLDDMLGMTWDDVVISGLEVNKQEFTTSRPPMAV